MTEYNDNSKRKSIFMILLGILMAGTALCGYLPLPFPAYYAEFTFISNMTGGLLLLIDGIMNLSGKGLPKILHLNVGAGLLLVFLICLATLATPTPFNFGGAFLFLHVVNPILFAISYIFLRRDNADSTMRHILAAPIFAEAYLFFDYILGNIRGYFVYGFFMPDTLSIPIAIAIGAVVFILMMLLGLLLFALNRAAHKNS